ncbi:hypothetical protein EG328_006126, partial [Venturia inaequalis]
MNVAAAMRYCLWWDDGKEEKRDNVLSTRRLLIIYTFERYRSSIHNDYETNGVLSRGSNNLHDSEKVAM